ncbi:helicase-related protein [Arthrobacter sp. NicSoilB8]|uniref:helicase-related protein n=1 Tax=Arthrobacter sp. NicSoilB8 TaxID=2830998 RepID=UPI001CC5B2F6|nr:helicase-related protein [Arthrobacter sp. NicSoilB8]BCW69972.1 RNA helicase [Arthrobacter sp. NicSoilB8]
MLADEVQPGIRVTGLGSRPATVVSAARIGADAVQVTVRHEDGALDEQILFAEDLARLQAQATPHRWTFDADGAEFRLAAEALRMKYVGLSDPMLAVETSAVDPLPHQIRAVYGTLLDQPGPLRFLLADDPGAGKTIMAGLYLKELLLRGDVQRCLIVAPGGLVDQWQTELAEKFGLELTILTRSLAAADLEGDPFRKNPLLIARMDQLARDEEWLEALGRSEWDLVIVDEAHRMAARWYGNELTRTRRYELGEALGKVTRHLLLMTATPHAGNEANFQAFLALLDPDRFAGQYRPGVHSTDTSGLMRRMIKEDLLTFEGKPLFPERFAETVEYTLSPLELKLYDEVSEYVRTEMNRADGLDEGTGRRRTVGFALTVLQRRLASSPEAIYQSIRRRSARLRSHRDRILNVPFFPEFSVERALADDEFVPDEDFSPEELEHIEEEVLDAATAARTASELDAELNSLARLEEIAEEVRTSGEDRKWTELRTLVLEARDDGFRSSIGIPHKLIVFTEHRDTLVYLRDRVRTLLGDDDAVVVIEGATPHAERRNIRARFSNDPRCHILVATDAAGEGLNLQAAHLMVNYDLPWNPNRIEQRFGRIHRIGQREVCRLWNLVAAQTREGQVFRRLLDKIEEQRRAYGGKVFDVLGENAFADTPLRELLVQAIRYGERPEVRARLDLVIDSSVADGLEDLMRERALATPEISLEELANLRKQMDEARARRLQPHFVQVFVLEALRAFGGRVSARERDRYEITHVPAFLRTSTRPVAPRYSRITFEPDAIEVTERPTAELVAPGHPLMDALVEAVLERFGNALVCGATLIDASNAPSSPRLVVQLLEELVDGNGSPVSRRFDYVEVLPDGSTGPASTAPYLDMQIVENGTAAAVSIRSYRESILSQQWSSHGAEELAQRWAISEGLPSHRAEVTARVQPSIERTRRLVRQRLLAQMNHWYAEASRLSEEQAAGRRIRLSPATARQRAQELEVRLDRRLAELNLEEQVLVRPPRVVSAALVLPLSTIELSPPGPNEGAAQTDEALGRALDTSLTERRAVDAVLAAERSLGRLPIEMAHNNKGFDIKSITPEGSTIFIEVKGRVLGAEDFTVTFSEVITGKNTHPQYRLALVAVDTSSLDGSADEIRYVVDPFRDLILDEYTNDLRRPWKREWDRGVAPH